MRFLAGSYAEDTDAGVYLLNWDGISLTVQDFLSGITNPSYLFYSAQWNLIYVITENEQTESEIFVVELDTDKLELLQSTSFEGKGSCHVNFYGDFIFVANYESGSLAVLSLENGLPNGFFQSYRYQGSGADPKRQESSHVHATLVCRQQLFVADLGTDKVYCYSLNGMADTSVLQLPAGSGPRQLAYNEKDALLYVLTELSVEVFVFKLDDLAAGWITKASLSENKPGELSGGAIVCNAGGKYVYASNRGDFNEITVFKCSEDYKLEVQQRINCNGIGPRSMAVSKDGHWLMVANENSGTISVFSINGTNGKLTKLDHTFAINGASCVQFV